MPPRIAKAVPELFLTFLAPSFRPSLPRLSTSRRQLATLGTARKDGEKGCECFGGSGKARAGGAGAGQQQKSRMSGLAMKRPVRLEREDYAGPIASTSAVRLDSPIRPLPLDPLSPAIPSSHSTPPPVVADEAERTLADLPSILKQLKSLSLDNPDQTPSQIISKARSIVFDQDPNQIPPIPPPPIVLHPQPFSDSRFFTPFLLQAIILGASALGLFARRKVRSAEGRMGEKDRLVSKTARQEAEERVDGVQALNLLISAHAVPEALELEESQLKVWRQEALRPLVKIVSQAIKSEQPSNRLGVASLLHFISSTPSPLQATSFKQEARSLLLQHALTAYQALPNPNSSSPDFPLDLSILSSLLSLASSSKSRSPTSDDTHVDQSILDTLTSRILSSPNDYPAELLHQLGRTAARAKRLDIVTSILSLSSSLPPTLRLDLALTALDLAASRQEWRNDRNSVGPLAEAFTTSVERLGEMDKAGIERLDRGIYSLRTAFSIDRPLEPFITRATLSTLSRSSHLSEEKKYRSILLDVLRHLTKSRNPNLARQVFSAIPSEHLRLSYFLPLLSSSHASTSQSTWDLLLSHPSLPLTSAAVSARFTSLSHRSASPSNLDTARRDFQFIKERGFTPSIEIWNRMLHVTVRFGGDRAVENTLAAMVKAGIEQNEFTWTILLQREMIRQDEQVRTRRRGDTGREESERVKRRGGGLAQMRKIKEAIREGRAKGEPPSQTIDITPNLLLKNFTRWTVECDTKRLLQLTKVVIGVALVDDSASPLNWPNSTPSRPLPSLTPTTQHAVSSSVLDLSKEEYDKLRVPAFRTLISAFERRGRNDLAKELRRIFREEREEVERARCEKRMENERLREK
ncbi:hypothetical protein JCM5353_005264 [Sporobolomyces roseus]